MSVSKSHRQHNVTLGRLTLRTFLGTFPCFLCNQPAQVKLDRNNKPYFICEDCGVQSFIRRNKGIHKFKPLLDTSEAMVIIEPTDTAQDSIGMLDRITFLENKLKELHDKQSLWRQFFPDKRIELVEKAIKDEIKQLDKRLKHLAQIKR